MTDQEITQKNAALLKDLTAALALHNVSGFCGLIAYVGNDPLQILSIAGSPEKLFRIRSGFEYMLKRLPPDITANVPSN